jgi:hypothetical protein
MHFLLTSTNRYTIPTIYCEVNKQSKEGKKRCVDDNAVFITAAANPSVFHWRASFQQTVKNMNIERLVMWQGRINNNKRITFTSAISARRNVP